MRRPAFLARLAARCAPLLRTLQPVRAFALSLEEHGLFSHAAATAFFLFFSVPPAVLALLALVGLLPIDELARWGADRASVWADFVLQHTLEPGAAEQAGLALERMFEPLLERVREASEAGLAERLVDLIRELLPGDAGSAVAFMVAGILDSPHPALLTVSFVGVLWSASGATRAAMRAMCSIYEVRRFHFLMKVPVSLGLTVSVLAGVSLVIAILPVGNAVAEAVVHGFDLDRRLLTAWSLVNWLLGGGLALGLLLLLLRYGANVRQRLRDALPGALFALGGWALLGVALRHFTQVGWERYNATYGALTGVILLMMWCYLASLCFLLGAELNAHVLAWRGRWQAAAQGRVRERRSAFRRRTARAAASGGTQGVHSRAQPEDRSGDAS